MDFATTSTSRGSGDFSGIAMQSMSENPNPSKAFPAVDVTEHEVMSVSGIPLSVYVPAACTKDKVGLITFHDIGTNHESFLNFFNNPEMRIVSQYFTVYHICAPGHQHATSSSMNSSQLGTNPVYSIPDTADAKKNKEGMRDYSWPADKPYPSMDELAEMIQAVVKHFRLTSFVGFGMGAGSNVLARFALKYPNPVLGLFLLNPTDVTHSYYPWMRLKWYDLPQLQQSKTYSEYLLDFLNNQWFGWNQVEDSDLADKYEEHLKQLSTSSVAGYILSYIERTNLGLVRELLPERKNLVRNFKVDCCLVSGSKAVDWTASVFDMNSRIDPERTHSLMISGASGMVMEENPNELANNLVHFLRTIGLVVTLTPQKLKRRCSEQRSEDVFMFSPTSSISMKVETEVTAPMEG